MHGTQYTFNKSYVFSQFMLLLPHTLSPELSLALEVLKLGLGPCPDGWPGSFRTEPWLSLASSPLSWGQLQGLQSRELHIYNCTQLCVKSMFANCCKFKFLGPFTFSHAAQLLRQTTVELKVPLGPHTI